MSCVAYSPTSSLIALANHEGKITLWDAEAGDLLKILEGDKLEIEALAISPDDKYLFCGYYALMVVWDIATGTKVRSFNEVDDNFFGSVHTMQFSVDNRYLLIAHSDSGAAVHLWDAQTFAEIYVKDDGFYPFGEGALSRDGTLFATASSEDEGLRIYRLPNPQKYQWLGDDHVYTMAFAPDNTSIYLWSEHSLTQWDINTGKQIRTLMKTDPDVDEGSLAIYGRLSPDGSLIATSGAALESAIIDTLSGKVLHQLALGWSSSFDFSPDSQKLLVGTQHGGVLIEARTGKEIRRFTP